MGRRKTPITERLAWEIYVELRRWCRDQDTIPTMHAFWNFVLPGRGYFITYGSYRYNWNELLVSGLIRHERQTNAVIIVRAHNLREVDPGLAVQVRELEREEFEALLRKRNGQMDESLATLAIEIATPL